MDIIDSWLFKDAASTAEFTEHRMRWEDYRDW
jgi:hypothetical protein